MAEIHRYMRAILIDAGSSTRSLSVLLSAVETSLRTQTDSYAVSVYIRVFVRRVYILTA